MPVKDYIKDAGLKFTGRPKKKCNQRDCASSCSGTAGISPADP